LKFAFLIALKMLWIFTISKSAELKKYILRENEFEQFLQQAARAALRAQTAAHLAHGAQDACSALETGAEKAAAVVN
jgi:hypothetical protein